MNFKCKINETSLRLILIVLNYVFAMLSISLVALGVVYLNDSWWPKEYVGPTFVHLPKLLIVLGCLSFVASFAGCYISRTNSKRHLRLFVLFLAILLIFEITLAFVSFFNITDESKNRTKSLLEFQFLKPNESHVEFHVIEVNYKCCGIDGVEDYDKNWTCPIRIPDICVNDYDYNVTYPTNETNFNLTYSDVYYDDDDDYSSDGCLEKVWQQVYHTIVEIAMYILCFVLFRVSEIACLLFLYKVY